MEKEKIQQMLEDAKSALSERIKMHGWTGVPQKDADDFIKNHEMEFDPDRYRYIVASKKDGLYTAVFVCEFQDGTPTEYYVDTGTEYGKIRYTLWPEDKYYVGVMVWAKYFISLSDDTNESHKYKYPEQLNTFLGPK